MTGPVFFIHFRTVYTVHAIDNKIRHKTVNYVLNYWDELEFKFHARDENDLPYPNKFKYYEDMIFNNGWGSGCEIRAAAEIFNCRFQIFKDQKPYFHEFGTSGLVHKLRFVNNIGKKDIGENHYEVYEPITAPAIASFNVSHADFPPLSAVATNNVKEI